LLSLAGLANAAGAPGAGPEGFGRGGRLLRELRSFAFLKDRGDFGTDWLDTVLGQSEGLAPLVESTGNKSMKGAGV
jgi:hypothetical protein